MKKYGKYLCTLLAVLMLTSFCQTLGFAQDSTPAKLQINYGFYPKALHPYEIRTIGVYIDDPAQTVTASSSDESIIKCTKTEAVADYPGNYIFTVIAYKAGYSKITFTASGGSSIFDYLDVIGTDRNYSLSSDTTSDFTVAKGGSYVMKLHYVYPDTTTFKEPFLTAEDGSVVNVARTEYNEKTHDFFFRIDAVGQVGQSTDLYMGDYSYVPERLCRVTVGQNKNLRLDTTTKYECDVGDTYRFAAYTSSTVPPTVSTTNNTASARYVQKIPGGYLYEIKAIFPGEPTVNVRLNGEIASFPVQIKTQTIATDTHTAVYLPKGKSYTYKFTVTGSRIPRFAVSDANVITLKSVRPEGKNTYYVTVTSVGKPDSRADVIAYITAAGGDLQYDLGAVYVQNPPLAVTPPCKSDTRADFTLAQNSSYTFKLTYVTRFICGSPNLFKIEKVSQSGSDSYYKITALGAPGQASGFYMDAPGQSTDKVCIVTIGQPKSPSSTQSIVSDTNTDFSLSANTSYQFKITAPGATNLNFYAGTPGVFETTLVKHTGSDFFYKITAVGRSASSAGIYISTPGQSAKKICAVFIL